MKTSPFHCPWASEASGWRPKRPTEPQEEPQRPPGRLQERSGASQDYPKTAPDGLKTALEAAGARSARGVRRNRRGDAMRSCHWCHRWNSLRCTIRVRGVPKYAEGRHATLLLRPSVELPMERDPGEGCAEMGGGTSCDLLSGAVGGAPCGARSVSGVCGRSGAMRTLSLGLSVELPVGHDPCEE